MKLIRILFARRICSWCGKDMGSCEGDRDTHGKCQACFDKDMEEWKKGKKK